MNMKILVIGLGNPILGDDGVGWKVAEEVARLTSGQPAVDVDCFALGGLSLMERLAGVEHVILIDSLCTGQEPNGTVSTFPLDMLPDLSAGHTTAVHDTSLHHALKVGRNMGILLPSDENVFIVAIEADNVYDFSEDLSGPVQAAVPKAVQAVLDKIKTWQHHAA